MKELVVFLYGGLGNQIFQYAYARKIADQFGYKLVLNTYGFEIDNYYKRNLELLNFEIKYDKIENKNKFIFQTSRLIQHFPRLNQVIKRFFPNLIIEKTNKFENNKLNFSKKYNRYFLYGYWHDERYFIDISASLKKSFAKINNFSEENNTIYNNINVNNCVAVHMRFTHMIKHNDDNVAQNKYQVDTNYYIKSFDYLAQILTDPVFYIFSDKPILARKFLKGFTYNVVILDNNRGPDYQDVYLMSKYKYHIIANSSFSWWGAWLSSYQENVTIAPNKTLFTPSIPFRWITF